MTKSKEVRVNDRGRRIGESHPRARLSDHEIDLIRELYEELAKEAGISAPLGCSRVVARLIAAKFDIHPQYVRRIVRCERRGQTPAKSKRVK